MKNRLVSRTLAAVTAAAIGFSFAAVSAEELYGATPKASDRAYVMMSEGVSAQMTESEYWTEAYYADREESPALTAAQIEKLNRKNRQTISYNGKNFSIFNLKPTVSGKLVKSFVDVDTPSPENGFKNGKPTTQEYWDELKANCNVDGIKSKVDIQFGISLKRDELYTFPCEDFIGEDEEDRFYNVITMSEFMPLLPLVVLHESADGEWYYVLFEGFGGWVRKENVAICKSKEDWLERADPENFLVVTGRELRIQDDVNNPQLSTEVFPMGTRIPLLKTSSKRRFVNDREVTNCYVVKLPYRRADGTVGDHYSLVSLKEDVHRGYVPYTYGNAVRLGMKLLGDRYGWGGAQHSNDCSGIIREIYNCFGIKLPRVTWQIAAASSSSTTDLTEMTHEERLDFFREMPIGSIIFFKGHVMLYLGMKDGDPYCISAVGTYCDKEGTMYDTNSVIISNMNTTYRANGDSWLDNVQSVIIM